ncbi:MAG: alpha/beta hydrolase [Longicatena sp.]
MIKYKVKAGNEYLQTFASKTESDMVLLFLHGGPGSGAWPLIMHEAMQKLCDKYRCVFYDQRGCGLSYYDLKQGISFEECMQDVVCVAKDIRERFPCKSLLLCAEDLSGFLALQTQHHNADVFDGMILMNPILLLTSEASDAFYRMLKHRALERGNNELKKFVTILEDQTPVQFFQNQHVNQWIHSDKNTSVPLRHIAAISSWLFDHPSEDALHDVTVPTLLMQGSEDVIAKEGYIIDALVRMKNPFLVYESFPYSGRKIYEDQPLQFLERIDKFLKEEFLWNS